MVWCLYMCGVVWWCVVMYDLVMIQCGDGGRAV